MLATLIDSEMSINCQIVNMADVAAARREARRKRILENSQNRLQIIAGKKGIEECSKASPCTFPSPEENYDVVSSSSGISYQPESNGTILAGITHTSSSSNLLESLEVQDTEAAGDTQILNDFTSFISSPSQVQPEKVSSKWEKLMTYKYDVALLVVLKQLLYFLFSYNSDYFFGPLAIYTVTRVIWFPTEKKSQIADMFLLMNGMSANRVQKVTFAMQFLKEISLDISVYLFVTICIESLLVFLSSTILT